MPNIPKTSGNGSPGLDLSLRGVYNVVKGSPYGQITNISQFDINDLNVREGTNITPDYYYAGGSLTADGTTDMVSNWRRFDHRPAAQISAFSSDPNLVGQADKWQAATGGVGIDQETNSFGLIGFVCPDASAQQSYYIKTKITSIDDDDDSIGVILAWRTDGSNEYTLYAQRAQNSLGGLSAWSIVEDFRGTGGTARATGTLGYATVNGANWNGYPNGTIIEAISYLNDDGQGNLSRTFVCRTSPMNSSALGDQISYTVPSSSVWYNAAPYGFAAFSQADCLFGEIYIGATEFDATSRAMGFEPNYIPGSNTIWDLGRYRNGFYT